METRSKSLVRATLISAIIFGTIMFVFYYFADKDPLNKSLLKAVVVSVLYGLMNGILQPFLHRKKTTNRP